MPGRPVGVVAFANFCRRRCRRRRPGDWPGREEWPGRSVPSGAASPRGLSRSPSSRCQSSTVNVGSGRFPTVLDQVLALGVIPEGGHGGGGRGRPASGRRGGIHGVRGSLRRRTGPGTWISPPSPQREPCLSLSERDRAFLWEERGRGVGARENAFWGNHFPHRPVPVGRHGDLFLPALPHRLAAVVRPWTQLEPSLEPLSWVPSDSFRLVTLGAQHRAQPQAPWRGWWPRSGRRSRALSTCGAAASPPSRSAPSPPRPPPPPQEDPRSRMPAAVDQC